jgi:hypothetical protein
VVNIPSVPEIITVNSEELQSQIRDLLPSQNGFGSELQATNVITPIIDLTRAAEGSTTPELLQTALSFGSQTSFSIENATTDIITTTGFYRIFGTAGINPASGSVKNMAIQGVDSGVTKKFWGITLQDNTNLSSVVTTFDFVVFLAAGQTVQGLASGSCYLVGSTRQIATGDGTLVAPNGFPL